MSMEKNDRLQLSVQNHTADVLDKHTCQRMPRFSLLNAQAQESFSSQK